MPAFRRYQLLQAREKPVGEKERENTLPETTESELTFGYEED